MLDTVKINHVQHISFTQSRLTDAVSVILSELLSYEHPPKERGRFGFPADQPRWERVLMEWLTMPMTSMTRIMEMTAMIRLSTTLRTKAAMM